jgi:hypothetical protein
VEYIIANGWTTCLEFTSSNNAYIKDKSILRFGKSGVCSVRFRLCLAAKPR